jgi:hypothetical protein
MFIASSSASAPSVVIEGEIGTQGGAMLMMLDGNFGGGLSS